MPTLGGILHLHVRVWDILGSRTSTYFRAAHLIDRVAFGVYVCTHTHIYIYIYMYKLYVCVYTYTYIYIYTYLFIYIYIYI